MIQALPILTPPHLQYCTVKPNKAHPSDAQAWTVARCHRLLRPISSRIELLRKDNVPVKNGDISDCGQERLLISLTSSTSTNSDIPILAGDNGTSWNRGTKRIRKTYASRARLKEGFDKEVASGQPTAAQKTNKDRKENLQPGEISVPTPILARSIPSVTASKQNEALYTAVPNKLPRKINNRFQSHTTSKDRGFYFELAEAMREISRKTNQTRYKTYEGLYNGLEAILKVTSIGGEQSRLWGATMKCNPQTRFPSAVETLGSRSLLSTCLRRVPDYIDAEEKYAAIEAADRGLMPAFDTRILSTEIYSDLEALGTSRRGCRHLKAVVRAHGVHLVAKSIEEGLVDAPFASTLVLLCAHTSFIDESEVLLKSLLMSSRYPNPSSTKDKFSNDDRLLPLVTLEKFVRHTGRVGFYQRQIESLVIKGSLPLGWLGTRQLGYLWTTVFRSLSTDPGDRDATIFISSILPLICQVSSSGALKQERSAHQLDKLAFLENTLTSILTTISAISLLSPMHARNISNILRGSVLDCQTLFSKLDISRTAFIAVATLLVGLESGENAGSLIEILHPLGDLVYPPSRGRNLEDSICVFIVSISRCRGRGSSGNAFQHLQSMLNRLQAVSASNLFNSVPCMRELIVETAFVFARRIADPNHLRYAQRLSDDLQGSGQQPLALSKSCCARSKTCIRWEEGINEWVVETPTDKSMHRPSAKAVLSDVDTEFETPVRIRKKKRKHEEAYQMWPDIPFPDCSSLGKISDLIPLSPNENLVDLRTELQPRDRSSQTSAITNPGASSRSTVSTFESGRIYLVKHTVHDQEGLEPSDDELDSRNQNDSKEFWESTRPPWRTVQSRKVDTSTWIERIRAERVSEESEDELGL